MERRHTFLASAIVMAIAVAGGCSRGATEGTRQVTEEGCLTAGQGGLVLTRLTPADKQGTPLDGPPGTAAADQATELYVLKGLESELRPHVGQQVRVSGDVTAPAVAVVEQREPAAPVGTSGTASAPGAGSPQSPAGSGIEPRVSTTQNTRLATTEMQVRSVTPLNTQCAAPR